MSTTFFQFERMSKQKDMIGCSFWDLDGYFFEVNQVVKVHD
ncbi:MAG: hypothetical protein AAF067_12805 [Pseudomonadota bacterium]